MLYLNRRAGEAVIINNAIEVRVGEVRSKGVRLGFRFPADASVLREEVFLQVREGNEAAAHVAAELPERKSGLAADLPVRVSIGTFVECSIPDPDKLILKQYLPDSFSGGMHFDRIAHCCSVHNSSHFFENSLLICFFKVWAIKNLKHAGEYLSQVPPYCREDRGAGCLQFRNGSNRAISARFGLCSALQLS